MIPVFHSLGTETHKKKKINSTAEATTQSKVSRNLSSVSTTEPPGIPSKHPDKTLKETKSTVTTILYILL